MENGSTKTLREVNIPHTTVSLVDHSSISSSLLPGPSHRAAWLVTWCALCGIAVEELYLGLLIAHKNTSFFSLKSTAVFADKIKFRNTWKSNESNCMNIKLTVTKLQNVKKSRMHMQWWMLRQKNLQYYCLNAHNKIIINHKPDHFQKLFGSFTTVVLCWSWGSKSPRSQCSSFLYCYHLVAQLSRQESWC